MVPRASGLLGCLMLLAVMLDAAPVIGQVLFSVDVPPRKWKTLRLRNLPGGAVVTLAVESDGDVLVAVLDAEEYRQYPRVKRPLFVGRVQKRLSFSVTTPAAGTYYVVFDNRAGGEARVIRVTVGATRGTPRDEPTRERKTF